MKIYKFKDLQNEYIHSHFFQMIEHQKVWCAAPSSLNDNSEFKFSMDYTPSPRTATLLASMIQILGASSYPPYMTSSFEVLNNLIEEFTKPEIEKIIEKCRSTIGVTSFSLSKNEPCLWERYGGNGFGAAVEFEIEDGDIGEMYHLVNYKNENRFHVDTFIESAVGSSENIFKKILCTKTLSWQLEKEIRFLGKTPDVNITFDAPVTKVIIGNRVYGSVLKKIEQLCADKSIETCFVN